MRILTAALTASLLLAPSALPKDKPEKGFKALFNGKDLAGWYGLNPHGVEKLTGEAKEANLAQQRAEFPKHWTVENGELVNDGHGPYATTEEEFGDIDVYVDYSGNVFVQGWTNSHNLPTTSNAHRPSFNGGSGDGFVARIVDFYDLTFDAPDASRADGPPKFLIARKSVDGSSTSASTVVSPTPSSTPKSRSKLPGWGS